VIERRKLLPKLGIKLGAKHYPISSISNILEFNKLNIDDNLSKSYSLVKLTVFYRATHKVLSYSTLRQQSDTGKQVSKWRSYGPHIDYADGIVMGATKINHLQECFRKLINCAGRNSLKVKG
jgi:hypothetical protein